MNNVVMREEAIARRMYWVSEIENISGSFGDDFTRISEGLREDISRGGREALLDHLRLCGSIPEQYAHDSTAEKLYSKYTDAVISEAFSTMGLNSVVLDARGDAADVQARASTFSLVADAKAFRLSRTAKNQKDFKVQAMDTWRDGLDFAVIVAPIYQFPSQTSQIYQQAIARNVCILSYSHLAVLVGLTVRQGESAGEAGLYNVLNTVPVLHPSKSSVDYWSAINRSLLESLDQDAELWTMEKLVSIESLNVAKEEALRHLREERDRLLGLSHQEALEELMRLAGVESRINRVERIQHGELLESGA